MEEVASHIAYNPIECVSCNDVSFAYKNAFSFINFCKTIGKALCSLGVLFHPALFFLQIWNLGFSGNVD